ncbi:type IX secretion system membrane protein PorP/SprF [Paucihalobacter ruber]|uniref:Type IX secretion system membrane protein PorP/SprF n=1 Tax=Paucihalobacter ruber TaxID=2567861 RepID=A0A506PHK9_9FLAO|nr:PorP/SprF family type IX secretion system membrane protein [Paucihalobacter ruber]TPV33291.1 type IX secretion system membrane protein PorP/SprF [Paucihalobacter ruber]
MKFRILIITLLICSAQMFYSQEVDGVVALALPVGNSLTFNQFLMNPTFSFVRQQNRFISFTNKREWVQFENAPETNIFSYSGRFAENIGAGIGLFQQNYGVFTTFGGVANFAYNARLNTDSNLTFGLNIGAYSSGLNSGNVVTNFPDPSLNNIPSNFLLTINPGINYGLAFIDIGVSINNLAVYNFNNSELLQDNPEQSLQAHVMYTGYLDSYGFFEDSRFKGLLRSEFKEDQTIISGLAMLMVPRGIWAQAGYNSMFGFSGGIGLNITKQIAIEYNYENAFDNQAFFGPSHEITLAYKISTYKNYDYSREDDVAAIFTAGKKKKPVAKRSNNTQTSVSKEAQAAKVAQAKQEAEAKAKAEAEAKSEAQQLEKERIAQAKADELAKLEAENIAKEQAEAKAKEEAELRLKEEAKAKSDLIQKARVDAAAKEKAEADAKKAAEEQAKRDAERAQAAEKARSLEKEQAEAKARAEEQAKLAAQAKERAEAEAVAKAQQEAQAKLEAEAKVKADEAARLAQEAEAKESQDKNDIKTDELSASVDAIEKLTEESNVLLERFQAAIQIKDRDLKDLKEENDLNDQGIITQPKPFKSLSEENKVVEAIKSDLDKVIKSREQKIKELEETYDDNVRFATIVNDPVLLNYKKTIQELKAEQTKTVQTKAALQANLESINVATEIERKRRIKRAAFNSEKDRFEQDKATLERIKQNTTPTSTPLKEADFDFGEERSGSIQILKNVENVNPGFYVILAVHTDVAKRDDFLTKAVASGEKDINFFYDVNTSKYYIYHQKFSTIDEANEAVKSKEGKPHRANLSIIKAEN